MNGQLFRQFFLVFAAYFFVEKPAFSQGWERVYNQFPIKGEVLRSVLPTADDGLLVLGVSGTDAPEGPRSYLQKVDADGGIQWIKDLFPDTFGMEAWKMVRQTSGRLVFLCIEKAPGNVVPTYWTYTCDENGNNGSGPHLLVATSEAQKAWDISPKIGGGSVVTGRYKITATQSLAYIQVLSDLGVGQQSFPIPQSDSLVLTSVSSLSDGGVIAAGYFRELGDEDPYIIRLNGGGAKTWDYRLNDPVPGSLDTIAFHEIAPAPGGDFWVVGSVNILRGPDSDTFFIQKFTQNGLPIFKKNFATRLSNLEFAGFDRSKIIPTDDGGLVVLYETYFDGPGEGGEDLNLTKLDENGDILWSRRYGREARYNESPFDFCKTSNGFAVASWLNDTLFDSNDGYLLRTDSEGQLFSNYVEGQVVFDQNLDCSINLGEKMLAGWQIQALRHGELVSNALTDLTGKFAIATDTGNLTLKIIPPNTAWEACQPTQTIYFSQPFDSSTVHFLAQAASDCPVLEANISTLLLRRCFDSDYTVTWANRGTVNVPNAVLEVELDPFLSFVSSDFPPANQVGQTLFFNLGNLEIGDFGQIHLVVHVDCDSTVLGQAHCSTVKLLPDVLCLPAANWSGAHIEVDGICEVDSVRFFIKNTGTATTAAEVGYVIVEDELLLFVGQTNPIGSGLAEEVALPANGKTYRIEAGNEPNDPNSFSKPSVAVEGCSVDTMGSFSTSYVTIFPNDDGDPTADTDCRTNQGSFDPNRKDGFPTGYGEGNFIFPTTEIEYLIQFQNTGTDTAFSVIIRDTLDQWLDISTIKMGAASHPYRIEMLGADVLKFILSPIALPDSFVNEKASHGFVSFQVKPKPGSPLKTLIRNKAAIYFDFNAPVITNQTVHRIDTGFIKHAQPSGVFGSNQPLAALQIEPNPAVNLVKITAPFLDKNQTFALRVHNVFGKIVHEGKVAGVEFFIQKNGLPNGLYFIELIDNQQIIAVGRLIFVD